MSKGYIDESADISPKAKIGGNAKIWHYSQIREEAEIGEYVVIGRGVYVGPGVKIGANSKIQNYSLIYEPSLIEDGVFIGPNVVLTNDQFPRAINIDLSQKTADDWEVSGVTIRQGASIGAASVCVAPVEIGKWALVAAGSTVVKDVPAYALVAGTPAKQIGWVGEAGKPLVKTSGNKFQCPVTGKLFEEVSKESLVPL